MVLVNTAQPVPKTPKAASATAPIRNNSKLVGTEADDGRTPQFPVSGVTGHRVDGDKVDSYVEATVNGDGSWSAFMHTTPTGHVEGGCARYSVVLYDGAGNWLYARDLAVFCTGTRDGLGGPPDREDHVSGPPGNFPPDALARARGWSVVASDGEHDIPWDKIIEVAKVTIQIIATIAAAS